MKRYPSDLLHAGFHWEWDEDADALVQVNAQGERWRVSRLAEKRAEGFRKREIERRLQDYRRRHPGGDSR
jgi:hypothetical protein